VLLFNPIARSSWQLPTDREASMTSPGERDWLNRRSFLKLAAAAAATTTFRFDMRQAKASGWGAIPDGVWDDQVRSKVLEVCLHGGLCPWETSYNSPLYRPSDVVGEADEGRS
jgi:hypothetical protein